MISTWKYQALEKKIVLKHGNFLIENIKVFIDAC